MMIIKNASSVKLAVNLVVLFNFVARYSSLPRHPIRLDLL